MPINLRTGAPFVDDCAVTIGSITFVAGVGLAGRPPADILAAAVELCETFGRPVYPGSVVGAWMVAATAPEQGEVCCAA